MSEADYVSLRAVARERGESQAELAGLLADRGYDLWLWFDGSGQRAGVLVFPEHPRRRDEYAIGPGAYPLTQGSREMLIKRLQRGDTRTEGLEMLIETDDTLGGVVTWRVRLMEQDDSVCVVVNPADLEQMPPPSEDMGASGAGHPTPRGEKISENFEPGKNKPHTAFAAHEVTAGTKRGDVWKKLKRLASESRGEQQVELPGYGLIYLKRDRHDPENAVRYKHHKFDGPDDGELVQKSAFDTAWTTEKKGRMKET